MTTTYNPYTLSVDECNALGVTFPSVKMDNGEYRFRCSDNEGYGYALTKMPDNDSGWQNSHYHKSVIETYIVQRGWIGYASLNDNTMRITLLHPGQTITTKIGQAHSIFMSPGTIIHTVKHGDCSVAGDWFASPELDAQCKQLTEAALLDYNGKR